MKIQRESFIRFAREREMSNHAFNQNLPGTCYEVQMNLEDLEDFCRKKYLIFFGQFQPVPE